MKTISTTRASDLRRRAPFSAVVVLIGLVTASTFGCETDAQTAPARQLEASEERRDDTECNCVATGLRPVGPDTLVADVHLVSGIPPRPSSSDKRGASGSPVSNSSVSAADASAPDASIADDHIHVVVEIPAGTQAKWEVDKASGHLVWDRREGVRRVVPFLPYPVSYGLLPRTLSPPSTGGDGDPLDVLLLGPALPRGTIVSARVVAVLRMLDEGERDDKLVAIPDGPAGAAFAGIDDLDGLRDRRPGVTEVLETWLTHYDGPGVTVSDGWAGQDSAARLVTEAIDAYSAQ